MKIKNYLIAGMAALLLTACAEGSDSDITSAASDTESTVVSESEDSGYTVYADLTNASYESVAADFEIADGWTNGSMFNCTWRKSNCVFEDGHMSLIISDENGGELPYSGGEFRTREFCGFGKYEVVMKPIANDGVVSSFFTYTGPTDSNPWDEIDIEFMGKDTTKVQFNYFTDGKGGNEHVYDLGFDASEDFHTYGFEWKPDSITWYVDGEAVYTAEENIPQTPGKIMMNAWPGTGVDSWLNPYDGAAPLYAQYKEFMFTAEE